MKSITTLIVCAMYLYVKDTPREVHDISVHFYDRAIFHTRRRSDFIASLSFVSYHPILRYTLFARSRSVARVTLIFRHRPGATSSFRVSALVKAAGTRIRAFGIKRRVEEWGNFVSAHSATASGGWSTNKGLSLAQLTAIKDPRESRVTKRSNWI